MPTLIPENKKWIELNRNSYSSVKSLFLSIIVIEKNLSIKFIGTAFIVEANGDQATAITAAHNFEYIRKILQPNPLYHPTTPSQFLPPLGILDLSSVKAICIKDNVAHVCSIEISIWDKKRDIAVFRAKCENGNESLFSEFFMIGQEVPEEGELVGMIGFGLIKISPKPENYRQGSIKSQLICRVGRVEELSHYSYLIKGPYVTSSIAVFPGMSGGIVSRINGPDSPIEPFGLISHAPEPQPEFDCYKSGHSVASVLGASIEKFGNHKQIVELPLNEIGVGKIKS